MDEAATADWLSGATLEQRVLREHVASVYAGHNVAVLSHGGVAVLICLFGYLVVEPAYRPLAILWGGLLVLVDLYALLAPRWHPGVPLSETSYWARKYTRVVTLVSLATAPSGFLLMVVDSLPVTTLTIVAILGGWTRAVQARWPLKSAMFGYGIPMLAGPIIALVWWGGILNWLLAAFCTLNLVLTLNVGLQQNRRLTESLMLRFENEALAAQLKKQVVATERASAEKTRFLATASHDLRQPMHAIALFGAAMESALRDHPERGNAERLMRAVNTLGASLDTMLDVSRLDAGVVSAVPRAMELDMLLRVLHQTFSARAEHKGLQLRVRASGLWVCSDPHLLYRMLSNLVDNALKYTARGGATVVACARGAQVWLEVRDTGIGIAPDQLERIFEEFYQVNNPGRDRARGLGIGLSIVRRLARLLGHPVQVYSRLGRGTRFRLMLPLTEPAPGTASELPLGDFDAGVQHAFAVPRLGGRILLIDDQAEIREAMVQLLRAYSLDAVAVPDEASAAAELTQSGADVRPFSLLVCDYRLAEGGDGLQAGLRLRERFGRRIPLLLITGETAPERLLEVRAAGVPMLSKPVNAAALLQAIADLVDAEE